MVRLIAGTPIYYTTSGLKVVRRTVFEPLIQWHFVDFHAEAIVYLIRLAIESVSTHHRRPASTWPVDVLRSERAQRLLDS